MLPLRMQLTLWQTTRHYCLQKQRSPIHAFKSLVSRHFTRYTKSVMIAAHQSYRNDLNAAMYLLYAQAEK